MFITLGRLYHDKVVHVPGEFLRKFCSKYGISVGTFVRLPFDELDEFGEMHGLEKPFETVGGCTGNIALDICSQGEKATVISALGDDLSAKHIADILTENGVKRCSPGIIKDSRSGLSWALIDPDGERSFANNPGCSNELDATTIDCCDFHAGKCFVVEQSALIGVSKKHVIEAIKRAKSTKCLVVVMLQIVSDELLQHADVAKNILGGGDPAIAADVVIGSQNERQTFFRLGFSPSPNQLLITTLGKDGSEAQRGGQKIYHLNQRPPVAGTINSLGAGDGFVAGFVTQYVKNGSVAESMENGADVAEMVLKRTGGNLATLSCGCPGL
jgi:sugar/nucleoside kinase (ribokinase family)